MYKIHGTSSIYRFSDGAFIPLDERNPDYAKYLAWLAAGNTPIPAEHDLDEAILLFSSINKPDEVKHD
jgi:hypothetical protein